MKYIFLIIIFLISQYTSAYTYGTESNRGSYTFRERPINGCMFGNVCHENEYVKSKVYFEERIIKFISSNATNTQVISTFLDYSERKYKKQIACPSVMLKTGRVYKVSYDPYKNRYRIMCEDF